jgi:hypothetical protein
LLHLRHPVVVGVMLPTKPFDFERLAIIGMVHLGEAAADATGFARQLAALQILVGVGPAIIFASLLDSGPVRFSPLAHVLPTVGGAFRLPLTRVFRPYFT